MKKIALLAILSGCAGTQFQSYDAMKAEIAAQQAKLREQQVELSKAKHREEQIAAEREAQVKREREAAGQRFVNRPSSEVVLAVLPYATQGTGYASPPNGWGGSPLSILVENTAERAVAGTSNRETYCYLGLKVDEQPIIFTRENGFGGAAPKLWHVFENGAVRTASLIEPGGSEYFMLNSPGIHNYRATCYIGPPRMTPVNGQMMPVLQAYEAWQDSLMNVSHIRINEFMLNPVITR